MLNQNGGGIDGGTFLGDVENIDASLGAGITGSGGTFYGKVTNGSKDGPAKSARIRGGMFRGEVTNETSGMISGVSSACTSLRLPAIQASMASSPRLVGTKEPSATGCRRGYPAPERAFWAVWVVWYIW